jgi:uncharacterized protein with HEPN domain
MLGERDLIRVRHMLDAAVKLRRYTAGRTRADLDTDELLGLAVVRLLEILGEAARRVSEEARAQHPTIPWRQMAGTRDRLVHGYDQVDMDIVWTILADELPRLIPQLERLLGSCDP